MAYVNPIVRLRENNRFIDRGCYYDAVLGRHIFQATQSETFRIKVDATDILDGSTITASTASDGASVSTSVAVGIVTITVTNSTSCYYGDIDLTLTFSDGRVMQVFLKVTDPYDLTWRDYGLPGYAYPTS